jgi:hypothetical protein
MPGQSWQQTLVTQQAAGTLFNTYTTAKSVINNQAIWTMPAGYLSIGRKLRVVIKGNISNIVTTPGLMNFQVKMGPTANIAVFDSGNIQLNATAHTLLPFWAEIELTCRALGPTTSANFVGLGNFNGLMFTRTAGQTDDAQGMQTILAPQTSMAVGTGFDSTVANLVDLWVGFTISNAGNGIQVHSYALEDLNY